MRFCLQSLKSGGTMIGGIISAVGVAQWVYETTTQHPFVIHIEWYSLVILGLVIILVSSLYKAYSLHKHELDDAKILAEQERSVLIERLRQFSKTESSAEPLAIEIAVTTDNRSLADIYPELPKNKKSIIFQTGSIGAGVLHVRNNSQEPTEVEIEYEIIGGNIPILLQHRVDNIPLVFRPRISRADTISPKESRDVGFVVYVLVDRLHKGFKFPSFLASNNDKLGSRIEGRLPLFWIRAGRIGDFPYVDIRLRVIAFSAINASKTTQSVFTYRVTANPQTSELTIIQQEEK